MSDHTNELQEASTTFDRGSSLSVFHNDRAEDFLALILALLIALGVYLTV